MIDPDKEALADKLNQVHAELREEAIDFSAELATVRPAPDEWCAMEILGHVAEMHYSYVARAERLMASPGAELARDMQSPERIEAIERGRVATIEETLARLEEARQHALAFLDRVRPEQMAIQGHHRSLGPMTVRNVFERTIVGHARSHLEQLRQTRQQLARGS